MKKSAEEIKTMILNFAQLNSSIRAVYLEGSRVNPNFPPDEFQDYDVVFVVQDFENFITNDSWTNIFGEKIIEQQPETFSFGDKLDNFFSYLIIYKEGFRIDFSIIPIEKRTDFNDSLREIWLDKDGLYTNTPASSDQDYWVIKPNEKWFQEVCNEFWWVSTYVAKGLARNEIPYAIKHQEEILRPMLMQMLDWKIGIEQDFQVSTGKSGKFYPKYLSEEYYQKFLKTYSDSEKENIWKSLSIMIEIFSETAKNIAETLNFNYNLAEESNILKYLKEI
ncbi:aminoglycoside 6-adenylyltransferase [Chryseobacterium taklimakanense]|nr:aminoglycoside 6-adenylyltransferase [Chryseobacterium taklimakanense]